MSIKHTGKKMTITAANGETASRGTENLYPAAIVGHIAGKLAVLCAGWTEAAVRAALVRHQAGNYVNGNMRKATDFEIVIATADDLAAMNDMAAKFRADWAAEREQRDIDAGAQQWEPVADPDAWKAADAALIAARRK